MHRLLSQGALLFIMLFVYQFTDFLDSVKSGVKLLGLPSKRVAPNLYIICYGGHKLQTSVRVCTSVPIFFFLWGI